MKLKFWRRGEVLAEHTEPEETEEDRQLREENRKYAPTWERGMVGMGPALCPLCGSMGAARLMYVHLLQTHGKDELREAEGDLLLTAIEAQLFDWMDTNVVGAQIANSEQTLGAVREVVRQMGLDADVRTDPDDERKIAIDVKGLL